MHVLFVSVIDMIATATEQQQQSNSNRATATATAPAPAIAIAIAPAPAIAIATAFLHYFSSKTSPFLTYFGNNTQFSFSKQIITTNYFGK